MNVRNCRKCGRIFNYVLGPVICPRCREDMEVKFAEVKEYIQSHKGSDIMDVSEACEVEPSQIRQWIREDRLQFAEDSPIRIPCEKCGVMIRSGRFCDKCKAEMTNDFKSVMKAPAQKNPAEPKRLSKDERDRMRYL